MQEIRPDRVAIYIRWSTEDQSEGTTLAVQKEACQHYVLSQGWDISDALTLVDDGYSGGNLDRPALGRLRQLVRQDEVDCVVVYKIDRLSRNVVDTVNLVLQEWEDRTYLKSAREPIDTTTAMGKQFFYMLVSYAEWERNVIKERTFSGKLRRARDGRSPGFPRAYGFRRGGPGNFCIIEDEARVVRLVFDLAQQGTTVRQITLYLNDNGFPTRKGRNWNTSMVSKMLHNAAYAGRLVWGRRRQNPRWKKDPNEPRLRYAEPYVDQETDIIPAIVPPEQFDLVQRLMAGARKIAPAARGSERLLSGLIKCGVCGHSMEYNECGGKWAYYRCRSRVSQGVCKAPGIPARPVEEAVLAELRRRYEHLVSAAAAENLEQEHKAMVERIHTSLAAVESQQAKLEAQAARINRDYMEERITAEERRQLMAQMNVERSSLAERRKELLAQADAARAALLRRKDQAELVHDIDRFRSIEPAQQKLILRHFISMIQARRGQGSREVDIHVMWQDAGEVDTGASPGTQEIRA